MACGNRLSACAALQLVGQPDATWTLHCPYVHVPGVPEGNDGWRL